jgi:hypothetical protein
MKTKLHLSPFPAKQVSKSLFHSTLMMVVLLLLALGGVKLLAPFSSSAKAGAGSSKTPGAQKCLTCPEPTQQTIYAPLIDLPRASSSEINLNCRSSHPMDVTPTFYKTDGTPIVGEVIHLQPADILFLDTKSLIPAGHRKLRDWGGMSLSYTGQYREVWAQITLHGINGGDSVNVLFSVLNDARSNVQGAVWWMPRNAEATFALGNGSGERIHATLEFSDGESRDVNLDPFATEIVTRHANQRGGRPALNGKSESVIINSMGPAGSLIASGIVGSADGKFTGSIRFYDTQKAVQSNLYSTRFRLKNVAPRVLLRNTTAGSIVARPRFLPESAGNPVELPAMNLKPNETTEVNLATLMEAIKERPDLDAASVQIINDGAPGSLIGALYGADKTTGMVYDVPLRDSGPVRRSTGGYPVRLDDDYSTIISITNASETPAEFTAQVNYEGGPYLLSRHKLAAGETKTFAFRKMRDEQIPDLKGHTLPTSFMRGQFRWGIHGGAAINARLTGRAEILSLSERVSSSYSCEEVCPPSFDSAQLFPSSVTIGVGQSWSFTLEETQRDCYGNLWTSYPFCTWSSDPSIATGGGFFTGVGPGRTFINANWNAYFYDCASICQESEFPMSADSEMTVVSITLTATGNQEVGKTDHYISLINSGNVTITATLNPSDADPSVIEWTGGSAGADNLHRVVSTSSASDTVIAAKVVYEFDEADTVKVHVVDATTPPPAAIEAPKTFTNAGTLPTNGDFGRTVFYNESVGVNYPTYNVDAFFSSDRWVFRLRNIMHTYKSAIDSLARRDLPEGNPPVFPPVDGLTLEECHSRARSDLDITGLPAGAGPFRSSYWVQVITQYHENFHVNDYYSSAYWFNFMGLFESQDVEATTVNVIFDCLDTTTTTRAAAITKKTPTWDTAIGNRHDQVGMAYLGGSETRAHAFSNPLYPQIRNAIPIP